MGVTKTDLFSTEQNAIALSAKAFGHPARVAIIQYLLKSNACINSDLVQELGLAQATISQHLRELKELNLIKGSIEGTSVCYCLNHQEWKRVQEQFSQLFNIINKAENCC